MKVFAALVATAVVAFFAGALFGEQSVPKAERYYQHLIDGCHRFLEAGLDDDFGRCIAGKPMNSN